MCIYRDYNEKKVDGISFETELYLIEKQMSFCRLKVKQTEFISTSFLETSAYSACNMR